MHSIKVTVKWKIFDVTVEEKVLVSDDPKDMHEMLEKIVEGIRGRILAQLVGVSHEDR